MKITREEKKVTRKNYNKTVNFGNDALSVSDVCICYMLMNSSHRRRHHHHHRWFSVQRFEYLFLSCSFQFFFGVLFIVDWLVMCCAYRDRVLHTHALIRSKPTLIVNYVAYFLFNSTVQAIFFSSSSFYQSLTCQVLTIWCILIFVFCCYFFFVLHHANNLKVRE